MIAALIGVLSAVLMIISIGLLKRLDKLTVYGLALTGIGFLYAGFTWSDTPAFIINSIQAIFFLVFSYYGMRKGLVLVATGYFLHGTWDLTYPLFADMTLIPPHYQWFCSSLDWTVGLYLIFINYYSHSKKPHQ